MKTFKEINESTQKGVEFRLNSFLRQGSNVIREYVYDEANKIMDKYPDIVDSLVMEHGNVIFKKDNKKVYYSEGKPVEMGELYSFVSTWGKKFDLSKIKINM